MSTEIKGPLDLEKEVIKADLCTLCGACVGLCPYFRTYKGRVVLVDHCNLSQGRCYAFCPRTPSNLEGVNQITFGAPYPGDALGTHRQVVIAKSKDKAILAKGQYGGVTSTLVALALKKKMLDAAVLTKEQKSFCPRERWPGIKRKFWPAPGPITSLPLPWKPSTKTLRIHVKTWWWWESPARLWPWARCASIPWRTRTTSRS